MKNVYLYKKASNLILASQSPARAQLLRAGGYRFRQAPSGLREKPRRAGQAFADWLIELATQKALAVARRHPRAVVIGCDTGILFRGRIIGKAGTAAAAARLLASLAGQTHLVSTGICVAFPAGGHGKRAPLRHRVRTGAETARVALRPLSPGEIRAYLAAVRPFACAGAYALQGGGGAVIRRIDGDPTAVIGLPLGLLRRLLRPAGRGSRRPAGDGRA